MVGALFLISVHRKVGEFTKVWVRAKTTKTRMTLNHGGVIATPHYLFLGLLLLGSV